MLRLGTGLDKVIALADSIADYGLINAITIRPVPAEMQVPLHVKYLVVTGERRWWAHVALSSRNRKIQPDSPDLIVNGDPNFIRAESTAAESPIRILQWVENIQRDDINVVEKARGLELIREELKTVTGKEKITWADVEGVAQIGKSQRIRIMRVLDRLDEEVIHLITQHNLTERAVRPIVEKLSDKPKLQLQAINYLIWMRSEEAKERDNPEPIKTLESYISELKTASKPVGKSAPRNTGLAQWHKKLTNANGYLAQIAKIEIDELSEEDKTYMRNDLVTMQDRIDALMKQLK